MKVHKKSVIVAVVVLAGTLSVGGSAYAYVTSNKNIADCKIAINKEESSLNKIDSSLNKMLMKSGYLSPTASLISLNDYKKKINQLKDVNVGFHLDTRGINSQLNRVKVSKRDDLDKINTIEKKLSIQDKVNSLFVDTAIDGGSIVEQPIKDSLTQDEVDSVSRSITIKENSGWMSSIKMLINNASEQVGQVDKTSKLLSALIQSGSGNADVSKDALIQAVAEVNKVENPSVKQTLSDSLLNVIGVPDETQALEQQRANAMAQIQAQSIK